MREAPDSSEALGVYGDFVSLAPRVRLLGLLLVGSVVVCWVAVGFDIADTRLLGEEAIGRPVSASRKAAYEMIGELIYGFQAVVLLATAGVFVEWLYQARINLRAFGTRRLRYSRGWAVWGFLIPGLNLIRPYQVLREVAKASHPSVVDPFGWTAVRPTRLMGLWWGAVLVGLGLELAGLGMLHSADLDPERLRIARLVLLGADVVAALSLSLAYFLVEHLSALQEEKWRRRGPWRAPEHLAAHAPPGVAAAMPAGASD